MTGETCITKCYVFYILTLYWFRKHIFEQFPKIFAKTLIFHMYDRISIMQTHHIPPTRKKAPSRGKPEFKLSNIDYLDDNKQLLPLHGRKYIYVLFSSSKIKKFNHIPFYVGQTKNIQSRFFGHNEVSWHYGKFQRQAIIHVIASVPDRLANKAEEQTIKALINKGFLLNNRSLNNATSKAFRDLNYNEMTEYSFTIDRMPLTSLFRVMKNTWENKEAGITEQQSAITAETATENSNNISHLRLARVVRLRLYHNNQSRNLSIRLAEHFDEKTQTATWVFKDSPKKTIKESIELIQKQLKGLNGDWVLVDKHLILNKPLTFVPTNNLLNAPAVKKYKHKYATELPVIDKTPEKTISYSKLTKKELKKEEFQVSKRSLAKEANSLQSASKPPVLSGEKKSIEEFIETISTDELNKVIDGLSSSVLPEQFKLSAKKVSSQFSPIHGFSLAKGLTKEEKSGMRLIWCWVKRKEVSAFFHFYPTRIFIEALIRNRNNSSC